MGQILTAEVIFAVMKNSLEKFGIGFIMGSVFFGTALILLLSYLH